MVCSSTQGPTVEFEHRDVVLLCSNDYLGLADHPALRQSLAHASAEHGPGAAASRLISGTHEIHRKAERRLATLTRMPAALLFSSGYAANVGVLSSLPREGDVIFSDALNHASIIDGCRLSKARVIVYPHGDVDALSRSLQRERSKASAAYVVTDALFSMDGDLAPLVALRELATRFDAALLVDEAHSVGVLGPDGAGGITAICGQGGEVAHNRRMMEADEVAAMDHLDTVEIRGQLLRIMSAEEGKGLSCTNTRCRQLNPYLPGENCRYCGQRLGDGISYWVHS